MTGVGPPTRLGDQAVALQQVADGAACRPFPCGVLSRENAQQLLGSPGRMMTTSFEQQGERVRGCRVRAGTGPARMILEPLRSVLAVTLDPLVPGLTTDPEAIAQLGGRERAASGIGDEHESLVHGRRLTPWHRGTSEGAYGA